MAKAYSGLVLNLRFNIVICFNMQFRLGLIQ